MRYTDQQRLQKILTICEQLENFLSENEVTEEMVESNYSLQWTVTTPLYNIGEQVYNLSKEFKELYPDIPWMRISGIRHRLVHDIEGTNWKIICQVLFTDIPAFKEQLKAIL